MCRCCRQTHKNNSLYSKFYVVRHLLYVNYSYVLSPRHSLWHISLDYESILNYVWVDGIVEFGEFASSFSADLVIISALPNSFFPHFDCLFITDSSFIP